MTAHLAIVARATAIVVPTSASIMLSDTQITLAAQVGRDLRYGNLFVLTFS